MGNSRSLRKIRYPVPYYYGGKQLLLEHLLPYTKVKHTLWVDVFGGGGSVSVWKECSRNEVYNDLDDKIYTFFKVLRDPTQRDQLIEYLSLLPYSRVQWEEFVFTQMGKWDTLTDLARAGMVYYLYLSTHSASLKSKGWQYAITSSSLASRYATHIERLNLLVNRIKFWQVDNLDFRQCILKYDTPDTLFYLDPPYVLSTRQAKSAYLVEMADADHVELVTMLNNIQGKYFLSGYDNEIYSQLKANKVYIQTKSNVLAGRGCADARQEVVWSNYTI